MVWKYETRDGRAIKLCPTAVPWTASSYLPGECGPHGKSPRIYVGIRVRYPAIVELGNLPCPTCSVTCCHENVLAQCVRWLDDPRSHKLQNADHTSSSLLSLHLRPEPNDMSSPDYSNISPTVGGSPNNAAGKQDEDAWSSEDEQDDNDSRKRKRPRTTRPMSTSCETWLVSGKAISGIFPFGDDGRVRHMQLGY